MKSKVISVSLACLILTSALVSTGCKKNQSTSNFEYETETTFKLDIDTEKFPGEGISYNKYDSESTGLGSEISNLCYENYQPELYEEQGDAPKKAKITSAYVYRDNGTENAVVVLSFDENLVKPQYILQYKNGELWCSELHIYSEDETDSAFAFVKGTAASVFRSYGEKSIDGRDGKYVEQKIYNFDFETYGCAKVTDYDIPFDDTSSLDEIRNNLTASIDDDLNKYLNIDSFELISYKENAVTENVEGYLETQLGFSFGDFEQTYETTEQGN